MVTSVRFKIAAVPGDSCSYLLVGYIVVQLMATRENPRG